MRYNTFKNIFDSEEFKKASKFNIPNKPLLVDIELTNHCNLRCRMCSQNIMVRKRGYISKEIFENVIDECDEYGIPLRLVRWGEPFLHPKVIEFSKYIKSKDLPLQITTNGLLLTKEQMKDLVNMELDVLVFSMQGATRQEYENMRNNNKYDTLVNNILKLIKLRENKDKPFIHISSTMSEIDSEEDIRKYKNKWESIVDSVAIGITNMARVKNLPSDDARFIPCKEIYQKLSIDWDGKITPCCADYDNLLTIGNINKHSLLWYWNNSEELKSIRQLLDGMNHRFFKLCSNCYPAYREFHTYGDFGNKSNNKEK